MRLRALLLTVVACLLGCPPIMVERGGHRVFNPALLFLLDGRARDGWQQPEAVVRALDLPQDAVVADIGAGGGYFTERLSRELPYGHVYATDVQDEMLARLAERVEEHALANVTVVRAAFEAPGLPEACCDLAFFSSVYKEIPRRVAYMREVRRLLRPAGRVAILEFRPDAQGPGPPAQMRLASEQIVAELEAAGFELRESHDFLPRQSFLVFGIRRAGAPGS